MSVQAAIAVCVLLTAPCYVLQSFFTDHENSINNIFYPGLNE